MAVAKELLQMDLYALLGIEEKAADKEVRMIGEEGRFRAAWRPLLPRRLAHGWHPPSRFGRALGGERGVA